jgi:hypothetical protein
MLALRTRYKAFIPGAIAVVLLLSATTPIYAESEGHEVMVAMKSLFTIKVALGLYHSDHAVYPTGNYTSYEELACVLSDRYGIPYMELPSEWENGGSFEFVSYSGDRESFVINVRAMDCNGTIVSATPHRVVVR